MLFANIFRNSDLKMLKMFQFQYLAIEDSVVFFPNWNHLPWANAGPMLGAPPGWTASWHCWGCSGFSLAQSWLLIPSGND